MCGNLLQLISIGYSTHADLEQQTFLLKRKRYAYHKSTPR